jgi:hypothetical protein
MKPVERGEVLGLSAYEPVREPFRARVIAEKKRRRSRIGPKISVVFENHDTVLLQIQEMLRTERISREGAVQHEIDTYNELIPGKDQVSTTCMIEIEEKAEREAFLKEALGLEKAISLRIGPAGEHTAPALVLPERALEDRVSAVLYLKFQLGPAAVAYLRDTRAADAAVSFVADHPAYRAETKLEPRTVEAMKEDLFE